MPAPTSPRSSSSSPPPISGGESGREGAGRWERLARTLEGASTALRAQVRIGVPGPPPETAVPASAPAEAWLEPLLQAGALVELTGARSSGRTALAYRAALGASARGGWIGWVDPASALDPRSAQRAGVPLERLLWMRPEALPGALRSAELALGAGFRLVVLDLVETERRALARMGAAAWVRLQRAARRRRAALWVLGSGAPRVGSFATVRLELARTASHFEHGLFEGYALCAQWGRDRSGNPARPEVRLRIQHR